MPYTYEYDNGFSKEKQLKKKNEIEFHYRSKSLMDEKKSFVDKGETTILFNETGWPVVHLAQDTVVER